VYLTNLDRILWFRDTKPPCAANDALATVGPLLHPHSMTEKLLRIGSRASRLALWQAEHVAQRLQAIDDGISVEIVTIKTTGDINLDSPLSKIEGKGFFTKEIEKALLEERVDLAVHSLKDLETSMPRGLTIAAVLEREDPRDVLIGREGVKLDDLPSRSVVGTSSLRRKAWLSHLRPDLQTSDLRGNVPTRLQKYRDGDFDCLILAAAGVKRLGFEQHIAEYLPPDRFSPAVSQGALAVQVREGHTTTLDSVAPLDHAETRAATFAERAMLHRLEGGCQVPVGALGTVRSGTLTLTGAVCSLDGSSLVKGERSGAVSQCEKIGESLAETLLADGAGTILEQIREQVGKKQEHD